MKLKSILAGLENLKAKGEIELDIPNIENDSRKVQPGDMFIAIKGFSATIITIVFAFILSPSLAVSLVMTTRKKRKKQRKRPTVK